MPQILQTTVLDDSWATLLRVQVRLDDGTTLWRQVEDHGQAASVLPYDPARRTALLVQLFRTPPFYAGGDGVVTEAPAGVVDAGETAEATVRREALEEAGVRLDALEPVAAVWSSPGVSTERMSLFLAPYAAADRVSAGGGLAEEHENITVLEVPLADLGREMDAGRIADLKTLALLQALRLRRPGLFA